MARRHTVKLGLAGRDDLVQIIDGVGPADKLIAGGRDGLQDGAKIAITGEDTTLGMSAPTSGAGAKMERRSPTKAK